MNSHRLIALTLLVLVVLVGLGCGSGRALAGAPADRSPVWSPREDKARRIARDVPDLYADGKYRKCEELLEEALRYAPRDANLWFDLSRVQARLRMNVAALDSLARAVERGFDDHQRIRSDEAFWRLREADRFGELLSQAKERQAARRKEDPRRAEAMRTSRRIAELHRKVVKEFQGGRFAKAQELLGEILRIDPNEQTALYNLACVHARRGRPAEALTALHRSLDAGYSDFHHLRRDPDLETVRELPGYAELLARREEVQRLRAERIARALREEFGEGYLYEVSDEHRMVFATNTDRRTLDDLKAYLSAYAEAQWGELFEHRFDSYVTVVVPRPGSFERRRVGGFYNFSRRMLVAKTIGMEMTHEFTHALHAADQEALGQQHPIWVLEGLATLFESSHLSDGNVVPEVNSRLLWVKRAARRKKTVPFRKLMGMDHKQFMSVQARSGIAYAQVRYMMMYLYEKGKLVQWYRAYTEGYQNDSTGAEAMEAVFGESLVRVETAWRQWVLDLDDPPRRIAVNAAYIGVASRAVVDGVKVTMVVPHSGADKAGVLPGDVIVRVDGRRLGSSEALLRYVSTREVGDRLRLDVRRDEEYKTIVVELGSRPRRIPRPRTPAGKKKAA